MRVQFAWINWGGPLGMSQGVSILAAELAGAGHDVEVVHYHESLPGPQSEHECAERIAAGDPDVVLFSFGTNQAAVTRRIATRLKELRPELPTMGGGVHCTLAPEEPLGWGCMDYVFIGEADGRMDEVVSRIGRGQEISGLPNIGSRRQGMVRKNPVGSLPDVSNQHRPYFEGIDYANLCARMRGSVDVIAGRGCPYRCAYCHNAGLIELYRGDLQLPVSKLGFLRTRDPDQLLAECVEYRKVCGDDLKTFTWGDDMAVMSKPFLRAWADKFPSAIPNVPFGLNATLNFVDDEVAELLARGNCNLVKFGLESGSARLRRFMRRPDYRDETVIGALERLQRHGINSRAYVIVGAPTETYDELLSTFELAARLGIDTVRPSIFFPYPGTPLYTYCLENDLIDWEVLHSVQNYYTRSVIRGFEPKMQVLLGRILDVFPMLMNHHLGGAVGRSFAPLAERALRASEREWMAGERERLLEEQQLLNQKLRRQGELFYAVPFADRPDACFLLRERERPLVNIDDTPNLRIDAA
jgi:anaerobic magnesium-protoporphyrin IX monomethyl ester cyclase